MTGSTDLNRSKEDIKILKSFVENLTQERPRPSLVSINPSKLSAQFGYKSKQHLKGNLHKPNPLPNIVKGSNIASFQTERSRATNTKNQEIFKGLLHNQIAEFSYKEVKNQSKKRFSKDQEFISSLQQDE